jgi:hypothetical protein
MVGKHKGEYLGWWASAEASSWVKAEAERRGVSQSQILTEALSDYRTKTSGTARETREQDRWGQ